MQYWRITISWGVRSDKVLVWVLDTSSSYPYFHGNLALWDAFTSRKWSVMKQFRTPRWLIVVHNSLNCHQSTAFITVKLEEVPVAFTWTKCHSLSPSYFPGIKQRCLYQTAACWMRNETNAKKTVWVQKVLVDIGNKLMMTLYFEFPSFHSSWIMKIMVKIVDCF